MERSDLRVPVDLPDPAARIPAVALRGALAVCGAGLSVLVFGFGVWLAAGVLFSLGAAIFPEFLLNWVLIVVLAAGELAHREVLDARVLVLLAGVHLLHLLGALALELPVRSWVSPRVLGPVLGRWVVIQIPCQLITVAALALFAPAAHPPRVGGVAVLGAVALLALGAALALGPRLRSR